MSSSEFTEWMAEIQLQNIDRAQAAAAAKMANQM